MFVAKHNFARPKARFWPVATAVLCSVAFILAAAVSVESELSIFLPSPFSIGLFILSIYFTSALKITSVRLVLYGWSAWLIWGLLSYYVAFKLKVSWLQYTVPSVEPYATIYSAFLLASVFGALAADRYKTDRVYESALRGDGRSQFFAASLLFLFPILYLLSMYASVRTIPLFSGRSFYETLYQTDFGPLYPFALITAVSVIYYVLFTSLHQNFSRLLSYRLIGFIALVLVTMADGKRLNLIIAVMMTGLLITLSMKGYRKGVIFIAGVIFVLFLYPFVHQLRTGSSDPTRLRDASEVFTFIGVEFRDSIYVVTRFSREVVDAAGYDWAGSTIGSIVNRQILSVFGFNKEDLVLSDSARTFMALFQSKFGIRVGIITELWFAFGAFGAIAMFVFGYVLHRLGSRAEREQDIVAKAFLLAAFGNFATAVMSQSTVLFGALPPLIYAYLLIRVVQLFGVSKVSFGRLRAQKMRLKNPLSRLNRTDIPRR